MGSIWIDQAAMTNAVPATCAALPDLAMARRLAAAAGGEAEACFDLGLACSTGEGPGPTDLVEAHKWFNLAALAGHEEAAGCRAELAGEMTRFEIAEAQRRARDWLRAARS